MPSKALDKNTARSSLIRNREWIILSLLSLFMTTIDINRLRKNRAGLFFNFRFLRPISCIGKVESSILFLYSFLFILIWNYLITYLFINSLRFTIGWLVAYNTFFLAKNQVGKWEGFQFYLPTFFWLGINCLGSSLSYWTIYWWLGIWIAYIICLFLLWDGSQGNVQKSVLSTTSRWSQSTILPVYPDRLCFRTALKI